MSKQKKRCCKGNKLIVWILFVYISPQVIWFSFLQSCLSFYCWKTLKWFLSLQKYNLLFIIVPSMVQVETNSVLQNLITFLNYWFRFWVFFLLHSIYAYKVVISLCLSVCLFSDHNSGSPGPNCLKCWLGYSRVTRKCFYFGFKILSWVGRIAKILVYD